MFLFIILHVQHQKLKRNIRKCKLFCRHIQLLKNNTCNKMYKELLKFDNEVQLKEE